MRNSKQDFSNPDNMSKENPHDPVNPVKIFIDAGRSPLLRLPLQRDSGFV